MIDGELDYNIILAVYVVLMLYYIYVVVIYDIMCITDMLYIP